VAPSLVIGCVTHHHALCTGRRISGDIGRMAAGLLDRWSGTAACIEVRLTQPSDAATAIRCGWPYASATRATAVPRQARQLRTPTPLLLRCSFDDCVTAVAPASRPAAPSLWKGPSTPSMVNWSSSPVLARNATPYVFGDTVQRPRPLPGQLLTFGDAGRRLGEYRPSVVAVGEIRRLRFVDARVA
jgi:hypothetical protein